MAVLREVAAALIDAGDVPAAVAHLRRALDEPPDLEALADVLAELGRAEAAIDPGAAAGHLIRAAAASPSSERRAELLRDAGHALRLDGRLEEAASVFEKALRIPSDHDGGLAPELEAGLLAVCRHDRRTRIDHEHVAAFLERLRRGEDLPKPLLAELAFDAALASVDSNQVRLLARQALEGEVQGSGAENATLFDAAVTLCFTDDLDEVDRRLSEALQSATDHGAVLAAATAHYRRGQIRFRQGRLAEAAADLEAALGAVPDGWRVHLAGAAGSLALVRLHLGEIDAARAALATLTFPEEDDWQLLQPFVLHARAWLLLEDGDPAGAVEIYELMAGLEAEVVGPLNPAVIPWRSCATFALDMVDRRADAKALAEEDFELAASFGTPRAVGVALRSLAFSCSGEERIGLLRRSMEVLEGSPALLEHAWTALALGRGLRADGQRREAVDALRLAQDLAMRSGALHIAQQALAELTAAGCRPRRLAVTGPEALTPGERRCAELAAAGRSDLEIAEELVVSVRAVKRQLSHAYRKLQVRGRRDLVTALVPRRDGRDRPDDFGWERSA